MKTYFCVCGVCGRLHEIKALFLSCGAVEIKWGDTGKTKRLCIYHCENDKRHSGDEIKSAYAQSERGEGWPGVAIARKRLSGMKSFSEA